MEKIMTKIRNLLDLASNNPNENEAMAAALKAQELMAKHNIALTDLDENRANMELYEAVVEDEGKHEVKTWKYGLAEIIAKNFCCKMYVLRSGRRSHLAFYGHKSDAMIAAEVFKFLYEMGGKFALKTYNQARREGKRTAGLMNTYLMGFRQGISEVLERQCTALMLVIPQDVEEGFADKSKNFIQRQHSIRIQRNNKIHEQGRRDGRAAVEARTLTMS